MRALSAVLTLLATGLPACVASEVYAPVDATGANRLANPGFEQRDGQRLAGWGGWDSGYAAAPGEGRGGSMAAVCVRTAGDQPGTGVSQAVALNQTVAVPIVVTGWSRAENVSGGADSNYSLYCDLIYTDGTPLWGRVSSFATGSHEWQRRRVVIMPAKPVRSITVYGLLRGHLGKAWFDDFSVLELRAPDGGASIDGVPVLLSRAESRGGGQRHQAGPLELTMADGAVTRVALGGADVTGPHPGGFLVRDAAAEGGYHDFTAGASQELGLRLEATVREAGSHLVVEGRLIDTRGEKRAVTLLFALPVEAAGWRWGQDMRSAQTIAESGEHANLAGITTGSNRQLSIYPLANIAGPPGGLSLAIDMRSPAQYRLGYSAGAKLLYIAYDFGLSPATVNFPSAAPFRFVIYPSDGAWGFRSALEGLYSIFPDYFTMRTSDQGIWQAFASIRNVEGWEDFGFKFKEGTGETAWDDQHDILTFRYSEMGSFWMRLPDDLPREPEPVLEYLNAQAADPKARYYRISRATLASGVRDAAGNLRFSFVDAPWCPNGALFILNPSVTIPGEITDAKLHWNESRLESYDPGAEPALDGEYLDSLEGFAVEDAAPEHVAVTDVPLTFSGDGYEPLIQTGFAKFGFVRQVAQDVHARGKLMMANSIPNRFGFLCAWLDIMGTETNWMSGDQYQADSDARMNLRRALAAKRPYLLLQNTRFAEFGPYVERYFQRALAYGMFPSMFSHNAAQDHYFTKPEWYNRDRELFKRYIPQIKRIAEEGWEPVTHARSDNPEVHLERFGPGRTNAIFITVHNPTEQEQKARLTFDAAALGRPAPEREVTLAGYATEVIEL